MCLPTVRLEIDSVATPAVTGAVPSEVAPSKNSTVPVAAFGDTVAVRFTLEPQSDGFTSDVRLVVVVLRSTVCEYGAELLPGWHASPPYVAVRTCLPAVPKFTDSVAMPPATGAVPSDVAPSKNS